MAGGRVKDLLAWLPIVKEDVIVRGKWCLVVGGSRLAHRQCLPYSLSGAKRQAHCCSCSLELRSSCPTSISALIGYNLIVGLGINCCRTH